MKTCCGASAGDAHSVDADPAAARAWGRRAPAMISGLQPWTRRVPRVPRVR
jgi:hypothetical protein